MKMVNGVQAPETKNDLDQQIIDATPKPATPQQINDERNRRILTAKAITLSTGKAFNADMANGGRVNIGDMALVAMTKNSLRLTNNLRFRDADNTDQVLSNDEVIEMGLQIAAQVDAIYKKSWDLKALNPIPTDYDDDSHWA